MSTLSGLRCPPYTGTFDAGTAERLQGGRVRADCGERGGFLRMWVCRIRIMFGSYSTLHALVENRDPGIAPFGLSPGKVHAAPRSKARGDPTEERGRAHGETPANLLPWAGRKAGGTQVGETPTFPRGDCGEVQGGHRTAKERDDKRNIIWTDGSRLEDGGVGAAE